MGRVNDDTIDRRCLDVQRLFFVDSACSMVSNQSHGGVPVKHCRTGIESFSKIIAIGQVGNGFASFTMRSQAGLSIDYGHSNVARLKPQGKSTVGVWDVNKITQVKSILITASGECLGGN